MLCFCHFQIIDCDGIYIYKSIIIKLLYVLDDNFIADYLIWFSSASNNIIMLKIESFMSVVKHEYYTSEMLLLSQVPRILD